jgi:hypothetical protein
MEIRLKKQPHAQQQVAIDRDEREQLYGGAKRGGKSVWLCQKSTLLNVMFPGNRGLLCRYNFTDLQDTTLTEFFETVPSELILNHHKGDRTIVLRTVDPRSVQRECGTKDGYSRWASRQLYRGLGDPDEFEKVKGIALGHLEVDEPSEVPFEQYLMLIAQFDWHLPLDEKTQSYPYGERPPYMALLASNPEPGWVEERFAITRPCTPIDGRIFIPSLPRDNPHLPPGFEAALRQSFPPEWVQKYLDGVWGTSEGAVFKALDEKVHDLDNWVERDNPLKWQDFHWPLTLCTSIDHATTGIVAYVIVGTDHDGNHYVLQEYYGKNRMIMDHCTDMMDMRLNYTRREIGGGNWQSKEMDYELIDPSTLRRDQQGANQLQAVADDYRKYGFPCIPAWNALELGINRMQEHLHPIPTHMHPFTKVWGSPTLFISKSGCPNLWKEMHSLKKKIKSNGYIEFLGLDHATDCVRYIINSKPRRPELEMVDDAHLDSLTLMKRRAEDRFLKQFSRQGMKDTPFSGMGFS